MRRPSSPEAEAWNAELRLERMDAYEDIAEYWAQETCQRLREQFAESYRRLVGIHPEHRDEFRGILHRIAEGGGMPVEDVVDHFGTT